MLRPYTCDFLVPMLKRGNANRAQVLKSPRTLQQFSILIPTVIIYLCAKESLHSVANDC
jgi:hypothetical protein